MARRLEVFYDVVSPYSYFCLEALTRLESKWNFELVLRPMFLGGVMQATGNKPPGTVPAKAVYLDQDITRLASSFFNVPLVQPKVFPGFTLGTMRVLTAISLGQSKEKLHEATLALFRAHWAQGKDISDSQIITTALSPSVFNQATLAAIFKSAESEEVKGALKVTTDEAVKRGAFGAPTIYVHLPGRKEPTMYFGSDRLHLIAFELGEIMPSKL